MSRSRVYLLPVAALLLCGCNEGDKEHLAGCGRKVADRLQNLFQGNGKIMTAWQKIQGGGSGEPALDERVSNRLHWEKSLKDAQIQVKAADGVVELKGTVRDADERRRAVDLAETTVGTEKVTDSLEIAVEEPK
jgi:hypothetical protein